jgi:hypothetical protein
MAGFQQPGLKYGSYYSGQTNSGPGKMRQFAVIGIILAVLVGVGLTVMAFLSSNTKNDLVLLAAKNNSFATLTTTSQPKIRSDELSIANSNASILLTSDSTNLVAVSGAKKLDGGLVKQQADTNGERLKQAQLLDKFDITYRQIVLDKIAALTTETKTLRGKIGDKKTRAALDQALTNLDSINKQFTQLKL